MGPSRHAEGYYGARRELLQVMHGSSKEEEGAMLRRWERQIDSETGTLRKTVERYKESVKDMIARGESASLPAARRLILRWFEPLRDAIHREQQTVRAHNIYCSASPLTSWSPSCRVCIDVLEAHCLISTQGECLPCAKDLCDCRSS
jgi:DNA-directed RNA polymerase